LKENIIRTVREANHAISLVSYSRRILSGDKRGEKAELSVKALNEILNPYG